MSLDEDEKTNVHTMGELLAQARTGSQNAYLIVLTTRLQAGIGTMHRLDRPEMVIGRSVDASIQIDDDGISRKHAKLVRLPNGHYQVVDLGSTNGTFLNGIRIDLAVVQDGDKIQLGKNTVVKFSLQDQLEEQYQRSIYESATRDGLTKIFNKKYFLDALKKEFAYCLRHRVPLSLVMFDVDHFKKINDTWGHQAGDYVLVRLAQRISETVRSEDLYARYGGEEFALMLRESTEEQAFMCAERCRKAIDTTNFMFNGTPIRVTISLGVANLLDNDFVQPDDLIGSADAYLYRAKRGGRNRVEGRRTSGPLDGE